LLIHPLPCSQIEDPPDDLKTMIDRADRNAFHPALLNPWLQAAHMNPVERQLADPGHEPGQSAYIVIYASLVLVLDHKFRCCLFEGP
jgi:hypothetical protein